MSKSTEALEGVFNPDISIRDVVAKINSVLETRYTTLDSAEQLLARMDTDRNEIKQLILDISNVMAQVHNGTITKTDAVEEVRPLVKQLKSECVALKLVEDLSPDDDITETELQMLNEAITQIHAAVEDHIECLKNNEGSDGEGRAATIADGAQTTASESLYNAMMSGDTLACESLMRSDNMSSTSIMSDMLAMEGDEGNQGAAPAAGDAKKESRIKAIGQKLRDLLDRFITWITRTVQRLKSVPVSVSADGKKFSNAAKEAAAKATAAANKMYAAFLKGCNDANADETDGAIADIDAAITAIREAGELKKAAKVTINNMPLQVFDYVKGTHTRVKDMSAKSQNVYSAAKAKGNGKAGDLWLRLTGQLSRLTTALQNNLLGGTTDAGVDASKKDQKAATKAAKHEEKLYSQKASDRAIDGKPEKKKNESESAAAESYDAIAMARAAAAEGNLEGVVESLLLAMTVQTPADTVAEESLNNDSEYEDLEASLECALLEADVMLD